MRRLGAEDVLVNVIEQLLVKVVTDARSMTKKCLDRDPGIDIRKVVTHEVAGTPLIATT